MITTNNELYIPDFWEEIKLFLPNQFEKVELNHSETISNDVCTNDYEIKFENLSIKHIKIEKISNFMSSKKIAKIGVYEAISKMLNKDMPWGALTGIRPTKLAWELINQGMKWSQIYNFLKNTYHVSEQKIELVIQCMENQRTLLLKNDKNIDFYVNIPFCKTRCNYCSFVSCDITKVEKFVQPYVQCLLKEIDEAKKLINEKGYIVRTVYIGGGTPSAIPVELLERIIERIGYSTNEFTVEVGRVDTINKELLNMLSKHKVSRISINPQSFNDKVLNKIGRNTTSAQILDVYRLARTYDFEINMDFIAGLDGETLKSFCTNVDIALELKPDNITIHTLCLKRSSQNATEQNDIFKNDKTVNKMIDYASKVLIDNNYFPYYMYRQKNMVAGLENVGYSIKGKECIFNINSMEEISSVIACGANAISKRLFLESNRIERCANQKDLMTYISKIDSIIENKKKLFE